jgi:hypothetical protein
MTRDHAFNTVYNELRDQEEAIGGPPSRVGLTWALVNALTAAGFDLRGADFRDLEAKVAANLEDFRS